MKQITETLTCELSEAELNEKGQLMSAAMLEYDETEDRKKAATKDFSESLQELRSRMRQLSKIIREKTEPRSVTCAVRYHNPEPGMKRIIREDTGEIVRDEQMTMEERQRNLFDDVNELNRLYGKDQQDDRSN